MKQKQDSAGFLFGGNSRWLAASSNVGSLGVAKPPTHLRGNSCSLKVWVKSTSELQGFRVVSVTGDVSGLVVELAADLRFSVRCGQCAERGRYRRHARGALLSPRAAVGDPGDSWSTRRGG